LPVSKDCPYLIASSIFSSVYLFAYTVKPVLKGHLLGQRKSGLIRQVTS